MAWFRYHSPVYESAFLGSFDDIFSVTLADAEKVGLPSLPRLVVMRITPLPPRTPNTAVAEASFSTEMFSTSPKSMSFMPRSMPSMSTSGEASFQVETVRMKISASSCPGFPE